MQIPELERYFLLRVKHRLGKPSSHYTMSKTHKIIFKPAHFKISKVNNIFLLQKDIEGNNEILSQLGKHNSESYIEFTNLYIHTVINSTA